MTFEESINEFVEWSVPTFKDATPESSLEKCCEEIIEIANAKHPFIAEEYVDALMCLFDSAARSGITTQTIIEAFEYKLAVNKARIWKKNENNTYSHL